MNIASGMTAVRGLIAVRVTGSLASGSAPVSDLSFWYDMLTIAGVAGLWVVAFLFDWIVTRKVYEKSVADGLAWKALYEGERDAHQDTRNALALASQRAEAGVEAARVTKALIDGLRSADKPGSIGA